jgi:hypothetical protein
MNVEYWWNETDRGRPKYFEKIFVHQGSHLRWGRVEADLHAKRPRSNHFSEDVAPYH